MYKLVGYLKVASKSYVGFITPIFEKEKKLYYQEICDFKASPRMILDIENTPDIELINDYKIYNLKEPLYGIINHKKEIYVDTMSNMYEYFEKYKSELSKFVHNNIIIEFMEMCKNHKYICFDGIKSEINRKKIVIRINTGEGRIKKTINSTPIRKPVIAVTPEYFSHPATRVTMHNYKRKYFVPDMALAKTSRQIKKDRKFIFKNDIIGSPVED